MTPHGQPEVWLRGPIDGVPAELMPAAHALLQAAEDLPSAVAQLTQDELWQRPGGAASIGFHLRHITGSIDRLLTYARGAQLDRAQYEALKMEREPIGDAGSLVDDVVNAIHRAIEVLRATDLATLPEPRAVGRKQLPSTVLGLLFHAAEHTQRHAGQIITTAKIVRGTTADSSASQPG